MARRLILDAKVLDITVKRLCQQLIENHDNFSNTVIIGLQPRGISLAERIKNELEATLKKKIPYGQLDITFYRDDFRRGKVIQANETNIPFIIEGKKVILIDDVLYTGRSVRAAMDAMTAFGRPDKVELLVLISRRYTRDLPIKPKYIGKMVNTIKTQKVLVNLKEQGAKKDSIWLLDK